MNFYLSLCCLLLVAANFPSTIANAENPVELKLVNLYLYTPDNNIYPEVILINSSVPISFAADKPTIITTYEKGYADIDESCNLIPDEYLKHPDKPNVIVFDWSYFYELEPREVLNITWLFGQYIYEGITFLESNAGLDVKNVTLVGHGVGAHIMGNVGSRFNGRIDTIWGLDADVNSYDGLDPVNLLDANDAKYVNVIHTSLSGEAKRIGTSDFYPNGGRNQPGCGEKTSCSRARACELFAESINTDIGFYGHSCESTLDASNGQCDGLRMSTATHAFPIYYIQTNKQSPYACGHEICKNP